MSKKVIMFVAFMFLNLYGASYATGLTNGNESVSGSFSGSKYLSLPQPERLYAATVSIKTPKKAVKKQNITTVSMRRADVQNKIRQLITVSRKTSSDIRREIKRIKAQKHNHIKGALDIANKLDKYALLLQQKEKSLTDNYKDIDGAMQTMTDLSEQLQLQLQDAMNKQQQAMQTMSNIMKNQHDTINSIIKNLK